MHNRSQLHHPGHELIALPGELRVHAAPPEQDDFAGDAIGSAIGRVHAFDGEIRPIAMGRKAHGDSFIDMDISSILEAQVNLSRWLILARILRFRARRTEARNMPRRGSCLFDQLIAEAERYLVEARAHLERADGALTATIPTPLETAEREGSADHLPAMRAFIERRCRSVDDAKRRLGVVAETCSRKFAGGDVT